MVPSFIFLLAKSVSVIPAWPESIPSVILNLFQDLTSFIFLLAQENEPKEGHPGNSPGRSAPVGLR
jgi:hypothetical protein